MSLSCLPPWTSGGVFVLPRMHRIRFPSGRIAWVQAARADRTPARQLHNRRMVAGISPAEHWLHTADLSDPVPIPLVSRYRLRQESHEIRTPVSFISQMRH